jgi:hypothetical protein
MDLFAPFPTVNEYGARSKKNVSLMMMMVVSVVVGSTLLASPLLGWRRRLVRSNPRDDPCDWALQIH